MKQQDNRKADIQTESLTDLPVADEQADETKGGPHVKVFDGRDGSLLIPR